MKNIDFSPSLFDSGKPETPDTPERSPSNWPLRVTFLVALLVIVAGLVYIMMMTRPSRFQSKAETLNDAHGTSNVSSRITAMPLGVVSTSAPGYCTGNEIICTVATASKPADLLRKLVASIPAATANQYRVRLSITAIEESASESSDPPTP